MSPEEIARSIKSDDDLLEEGVGQMLGNLAGSAAQGLKNFKDDFRHNYMKSKNTQADPQKVPAKRMYPETVQKLCVQYSDNKQLLQNAANGMIEVSKVIEHFDDTNTVVKNRQRFEIATREFATEIATFLRNNKSNPAGKYKSTNPVPEKPQQEKPKAPAQKQVQRPVQKFPQKPVKADVNDRRMTIN